MELSTIFLLLAASFLAYSNGANDNFKGAATLFGSNVFNYKKALLYATFTTLAGSLFAVFLSNELVSSFSGKGIVSNEIVSNPAFLIAVGLGAALTVYTATLTGFPISTTHALVGALVGSGIVSGTQVHFAKVWNSFLFPLLFSPILAFTLTVLIYPLLKQIRQKCGVNEETCICIGEKVETVEITPDGGALLKATGLTLTIDQIESCQMRYSGNILGVNAQNVLNSFHALSAGTVCFARGLNDTPKIVALLLGARILNLPNTTLLVASLISLGGLLNAKRVAITMSKKITPMNHGQGFSANLITSVLVIFASRWGLPVSTTHVACGSLFGIGWSSGQARWNVIQNILLSWVITLPLAGLFSAITFLCLN